MNPNIQDILHAGSRQLQESLSLDAAGARIEVQCLLQAVLQVNRAWLLAHPEAALDDGQYARYMALFMRRVQGEPIAYLLGEREFYGLNFRVSPATLIPRPETELLVELALQRIPELLPASRTPPCLPLSGEEHGMSAFRVLDLGTGSGAIATSIAHARPCTEVTATDASTAALEVARFNTRRLGLKNVRLLQSIWFDALHGERFDIIVSNPPYIAATDPHLSQGDVRFEPREALVSGADGFDDIRHIISGASDYLSANGWLLLEHGYDQAGRVRELLHRAGFAAVFSATDLAGIERVSGGACPAPA